MTLTIDIPDKYAHHLELDGPESSRRGLEMMALEGYREEQLSRGQVGEMLGLSFHETEAFLHQHGAFILTPVEEYRESAEALERLLAK